MPSRIAHAGFPAPRVALVAPFWDLWADSVDRDLRARPSTTLDFVSDALLGFDVVAPETLEPNRGAPRAGMLGFIGPGHMCAARASDDGRAACIATAVLDELQDLPVVIWGAHDGEPINAEYNHCHIVARGATVGISQLAERNDPMRPQIRAP